VLVEPGEGQHGGGPKRGEVIVLAQLGEGVGDDVVEQVLASLGEQGALRGGLGLGELRGEEGQQERPVGGVGSFGPCRVSQLAVPFGLVLADPAAATARRRWPGAPAARYGLRPREAPVTVARTLGEFPGEPLGQVRPGT
jgi:hypothetical protein